MIYLLINGLTGQFDQICRLNLCFLIFRTYDPLSSKDLMGHVDFFPNGGYNQPGCKNMTIKDVDGVESGKTYVACNHQRYLVAFTIFGVKFHST